MKNFTKTLETERLILRKFKKSDVKDVFSNYASRIEVTKFLTWKPHKNLEETEAYLNFILPKYETEQTYRWAIVLKETNEVVGCIDVVDLKIKRKCAELGYVLGDKFWGKGLMSEAGKKVLDYLFAEGFERIEAVHDIENPKSGRVMEKIGMTYEGTLKKSRMNNSGKLVDCKIYAIVK